MSKEYLEALEFIFNEALFSEFKNETNAKVREYHSIVYAALKRLESIDNSNPSEALKYLEELHTLAYGNSETSWKIYEIVSSSYIKQALLKAQEPKHYLKWEDLEFDNAQVKKYLKVKLGDNIYKAYYHFCFLLNSELFCIENDNEKLNIYITNKQFFNDLHLEVEE